MPHLSQTSVYFSVRGSRPAGFVDGQRLGRKPLDLCDSDRLCIDRTATHDACRMIESKAKRSAS